jgi:hypothetical protein
MTHSKKEHLMTHSKKEHLMTHSKKEHLMTHSKKKRKSARRTTRSVTRADLIRIYKIPLHVIKDIEIILGRKWKP